MSVIRYYVLLGLAALPGFALVLFTPDEAVGYFWLGVPVAFVGAVISTIYLSRVYRLQPVPRSRFYRMVLELFGSLILLGGWVGYLAIARALERAYEQGQIDFTIPAPASLMASRLSALIVILVFLGPVRFAIEVFRLRWRTRRGVTTLDRDE